MNASFELLPSTRTDLPWNPVQHAMSSKQNTVSRLFQLRARWREGGRERPRRESERERESERSFGRGRGREGEGEGQRKAALLLSFSREGHNASLERCRMQSHYESLQSVSHPRNSSFPTPPRPSPALPSRLRVKPALVQQLQLTLQLLCLSVPA